MINLLKLIRTYRNKNNILIILMLLSIIMVVVASSLTPLFIGKIIDQLVSGNHYSHKLTLILLILGIIFLLRCLFMFINNISTEILLNKIIRDLRIAINNKVLDTPYHKISKFKNTDILSRMISDVDIIYTSLRQYFLSTIINIFTAISTITIIFYFNVSMAIIIICITPIGFFIPLLVSKLCHRYMQEVAKLRTDFYSKSTEIISIHDDCKYLNGRKFMDYRVLNTLDRMFTVGVKAQFCSAIPNPLARYINALVYATVTICSSYFVLKGEITIGLMVAFLRYTTQYFEPFNEITQGYSQLQSAEVSAKRIIELLEIEDEDQLIEVGKLRDAIVLNNVYFSYNENRFIENLSLKIVCGDHIAIVGKTGSGKSTIIKLIMGLIRSTSGEVLFDGVDIKNIKSNSLFKNIGVITQESFIIEGSIYDNIKFGRNFNNKDVVDIVKELQFHDIIMKMQSGYDTIIGKNNSSLSSGEKQLICIARAMIGRPSIIIMDEATSDIDTVIERKIQNFIEKIYENTTSIIVAHRLNTIKRADKIIVLDDGKIVEYGNDKDLIDRKGIYYKLIRAQYIGNDE